MDEIKPNDIEMYLAISNASIIPKEVLSIDDDMVKIGKIISEQLLALGYRVVPIVGRRGFERVRPVKTPQQVLSAPIEPPLPEVPSIVEPPPSNVPVLADTSDPHIRMVKMDARFWENKHMGFKSKNGQDITISWGEPDINGWWNPTFHASGTSEEERIAEVIKGKGKIK